MKTRWKMRAECFSGAGSYTIKFPDTEISIAVDEHRYFELSQKPTDGMLSVARPIDSGALLH